MDVCNNFLGDGRVFDHELTFTHADFVEAELDEFKVVDFAIGVKI